MDITVVYYVLAVALVLVGLAGVILPALPGLPLVFAGLLLAAWADGFAHVGWIPLLVLGLITALSFLIDFLATVYGARRVGASKAALWGSVIGAFVGLLFMPIGLFVGPFAGAWLGEYLQTRKTESHQGRGRHVAGHRPGHCHQAGIGAMHARRVRDRLVFLRHHAPCSPRAHLGAGDKRPSIAH